MNPALTSVDFASLMEELPIKGQRFGVAVSGGADSLALCLLAHDWAITQGKTVVAMSVDHGLRLASADECRWVSQTLQSYGIEHHILSWQGDKPEKGIQAAARVARYDLMEDFCVQEGISDLFLAHHLDDQAETFLLRLARGSGVDGLSAMQKINHAKKIRLLRPLLCTSKINLINYLKNRNQDWIEDPSNQNVAFERVKMRNAMNALSELGLTPDRLGQTAENMLRARQSLEGHTKNWLESHARLFEEGYVMLERSALEGWDEEVILRSLTRIGMVVGGGDYPTRLERLLRLWEKLKSGEDATLLGCRWIIRENHILICREVRTNSKALHYDPSKPLYWDDRFSLEVLDKKDNNDNLTVRALGEDGWRDVLAHAPEIKGNDIPVPVIHALVSIWDKEGVSVVPHLGYKRDNLSMVKEKCAWVRFNPRIDLF